METRPATAWKRNRNAPSVVAKEQAAGGHEKANHYGWGRAPGDVGRLAPSHGDRHGEEGERPSLQNRGRTGSPRVGVAGGRGLRLEGVAWQWSSSSSSPPSHLRGRVPRVCSADQVRRVVCRRPRSGVLAVTRSLALRFLGVGKEVENSERKGTRRWVRATGGSAAPFSRPAAKPHWPRSTLTAKHHSILGRQATEPSLGSPSGHWSPRQPALALVIPPQEHRT